MKSVTTSNTAVEKPLLYQLGSICLFLVFFWSLSGGSDQVFAQVDGSTSSDSIAALRRSYELDPEKDSTVEALARALLLDKRREESLVFLAQVEARQKDPDKKRKWAARAAVLGTLFVSDETFRIFQGGLNLWAGGKLESAYQRLNEAEQREPGHRIIWGRLGQLAFLLGDYKTAVERLKQTARILPIDRREWVDLGIWLAFAQSAAGQSVAAQETWAKLLKKSGKSDVRSLLFEAGLAGARQDASHFGIWIDSVARTRLTPAVRAELGVSWLELRAEEAGRWTRKDQERYLQLQKSLELKPAIRPYAFGEGFELRELLTEQGIAALRARKDAAYAAIQKNLLDPKGSIR